MMTMANWAAGFCILATSIQVVSTAIAAWRCRACTSHLSPPDSAPAVTIVRPVCGIDNFERETLASSFGLDYPDYRVIFCAARADDAAVALVRELIAAHPGDPATLLIGDDRAGPNPKLNNTIKGFDAARTDWIIMADSNVMMPRDYIQRLLARWRPNSGVVVSVPIGARPGNFWAELECAFLSTFQARWEYVADTFGIGFAQGKNMLFRRDILEAGGGIRALGAEVAEDAATTKMMRAQNRKAHVMDSPFEQPLGRRSASQVWGRQVRWARLRRITFPVMFAPEILTGSALPLLAGLYFAASQGLNLALVAGLLLAIWCGAEAMMARCAGWHFSWRMPLAILIRDLLLPVIWVDAWINNEVVWRGSTVSEAKVRGFRMRELTELPAYAYARKLTDRYRQKWRSR
jgi:ceramide glucosyltransferase